MNFLVKTLSTLFYVGYLPFIPGTFGSIAALFLFYCLPGDIISYTVVTLLVIVLGFLICGRAEKLFQAKDSRLIVIDELSGMLLSLYLVPAADIKLVLSGFFAFRLLDTLKPFPAARLQHLPGSLGIMADDLVAGVYTNIVLQLSLRLASFKTS